MKPDYIEFQDRSIALAYMVAFRCYGTWLHGDVRGSVGRRTGNIYGEPRIKPSSTLRQMDAYQLAGSPFDLGAVERRIVEDAIREVCTSARIYYVRNKRSN